MTNKAHASVTRFSFLASYTSYLSSIARSLPRSLLTLLTTAHGRRLRLQCQQPFPVEEHRRRCQPRPDEAIPDDRQRHPGRLSRQQSPAERETLLDQDRRRQQPEHW